MAIGMDHADQPPDTTYPVPRGGQLQPSIFAALVMVDWCRNHG